MKPLTIDMFWDFAKDWLQSYKEIEDGDGRLDTYSRDWAVAVERMEYQLSVREVRELFKACCVDHIHLRIYSSPSHSFWLDGDLALLATAPVEEVLCDHCGATGEQLDLTGAQREQLGIPAYSGLCEIELVHIALGSDQGTALLCIDCLDKLYEVAGL